MSSTTDRLYQLLPAIYRARDLQVGGESLRALIGVIEKEFQDIFDDIDTLYDNWFVETCQDWAVPYIGDLLGVRELNEIPNGAFSRRAYVANTLAYRKRKGTPAVVEQLARDVTGWPSRVVEYFQLLAQTQHLNHIRRPVRLLDIRDGDAMELIGSPFERAWYSAEVRRISQRAGRYNIPSVGIYQWRLGSYPVYRAQASVADKTAEGVAAVPGKFYRFSQFGHDMPLFNRPETEQSITTLAEEINVPGRLRRRPLFDELEARRAAVAAGLNPTKIYFDEQSVLDLYWQETAGGAYTQVAPENIRICNLSTWREPVSAADFHVDPVLGRISAKSTKTINDLRVSYSYGFSADIGGGSYNRRDTLAVRPAGSPTVHKATVAKGDLPEGGSPDYTTIQAALDAFRDDVTAKDWIVEIADSSTYTGDVSLEIPPQADPDATRWLVVQARDGERPVLDNAMGSTEISCTHERAAVTFNGIVVTNGYLSVTGNLSQLTLLHCTLTPGIGLDPDGAALGSTPSLVIADTNTSLEVTIKSSIVGIVEAPEVIRSLSFEDCIVDGLGATASDPAVHGGKPATVYLASAPLSFVRTTVLGAVLASELTYASESIFRYKLDVFRRQVGCVRFCYVTPDSRTPRRYYCQPDLAAKTDKRTTVAQRVRPEFVSTFFGTPAYAQLKSTTPIEIRSGAEDGSEMGAFNQLKAPQREANLRIGLEEYMRLGLDTGTFFVT